MKLFQLLFYQQVLLTTLCLLTISPPALADPSTSDDYVLSAAVFSDSGGEANSTEYSLIATVGTPFAEMDATGETEPVGDRIAHGTLRDDQGHPIAGVTLEIDGKTATTDALGNWEINGLVDETTYTVTARKVLVGWASVYLPTNSLPNGKNGSDAIWVMTEDCQSFEDWQS